MNIQPVNDQILILRDPEDSVSTGGILIPDAAHNSKMPRGRGIVLAVGPGRRHHKTGVRVPVDVNKGDHVVFSKLSGDKVRDDLCVGVAENNLLLLSESEILCVIEDDT